MNDKAQKTNFQDPELPVETRIESALQALTLDEKLSLCAGQNFWQTRAIPRLGIKPFRLTDGPRGVAFHSSGGRRCTAFPSGISQAATWDEKLMARFGEALAKECRSVGGRTILGPAINITRTPLNGRTFEYFSEDPLLNAKLTVPMVKGVQSQGVAACVKHFAANNQETNRVRVSSEVSERALEEIYLPAFKAAVEEADAWSVMAAYNKVNGIASCEHTGLLQDKLRGEYGFRGFVVSDWFAVRSTSSAEACVKAGLNLEMPGKGSRLRHKNVRKAFADGGFTESELDENIRGLLRVMVLTGHLDTRDESAPRFERNTPEHQNLALEMAEAGITLLKNTNSILPLDPGKQPRIAVLGPKLKKKNCLPLWGGSAGVWSPYEITPKQGLEAMNCGRFEWVKSPAKADAVLLFVGLSHRPGLDSEGVDRKTMDLPEKQVALIRKTVAANPNTIVVLMSGSPVTMPWLDDVPCVLQAWYPGMEGGTAIANVLFGDTNPAGKLPVTFPRQLSDSPAHQSERSWPGDKKSVHYDEELFVGYRHFDKRGIEPLFPFGHGLSYTSFAFSDLKVNGEQFVAGDTVEVSLNLTNTGAVSGSEVLQLYLIDKQAEDDRPEKSLKAFSKVRLLAGESERVALSLSSDDFSIFCPETKQWQLREGEYTIALGSSSRDIHLQHNVSIIGSSMQAVETA